MDRYLAWGAGSLIAIAAVLGFSAQSGRTPAGGNTTAKESKKALPPRIPQSTLLPGICSDLENTLQAFLLASENDVAAPDSCYAPGVSPDAASRMRLQGRSSSLKFLIVTLPDPLHTHFSLLFDRKVEAIQQAAQDAGFDYDSSWLPWETAEYTFTHLADQDAIEGRREAREEQPGVILFRRRSDKPLDPPGAGQQAFEQGLAVFVVGEEPTRGIHRRQFQNAAAWIATLQASAVGTCLPIAILGPTFSGSLPSLAQLLADDEVHKSLNYPAADNSPDSQLRIYSGSISGKEASETFAASASGDLRLRGWHIHFHSFIETDDKLLKDYCDYLARGESQEAELSRVALISEDETAYGIGGIKKEKEQGQATEKRTDNKAEPEESVPCHGAVRLFYPRDISALRAAYQAQSIFSSPAVQPPTDSQHRTLSTDLADPAGETHDTVPSYGGNQTPLAEEAQLLGILEVLQDHHSEYLVIRSSNTIDQLFLTNFFRRLYPQGRIVIRGADTLFLRERGSSGISGVVMLSSYPLFPWDWRDWLNPSSDPTHRVFGEETVEGTYIAMRFLVQETFHTKDIPDPLDGDAASACSSNDKKSTGQCFLPPNSSPLFEIPDYKTPFWLVPETCRDRYKRETLHNAKEDAACLPYLRPATWISVLGRDHFYPLAAFGNKIEAPASSGDTTPSSNAPQLMETKTPSPDRTALTDLRFSVPLVMKICLLVILAFAAFHLWCCWSASFTAKPAFRAHFAVTKDWFPYGTWQHPALITIGCLLIAFVALASAWGCGAFSMAALSLGYRAWIWLFLLSGLLISFGSVLANQQAAHRLETFKSGANLIRRYFAADWKSKPLTASLLGFGLGVLIFICGFVCPLEHSLDFQNQLPVYWRSMNLYSGVSPLVPFLILFAGMYMWFWYSLHGLALFGMERPQLPAEDCLFLRDEMGNILKDGDGNPVPYLRMFSQKKAQEMESVALPLEYGTCWLGLIILFTISTVAFATASGIPFRSLGSGIYAVIFFFLFALCISWMLAEACQLLRAWRKLKQLLNFLDRVALRRTMSTLQGFSWGNVWRMSGNVLDVRYKLLSRQIETLSRLAASFREFESTWHNLDQWNTCRAVAACQEESTKARGAMDDFAAEYGANYDQDDFADFRCLQTFQKTIGELVGKLLTELLIPEWRTETQSLIRNEAKNSDSRRADSESVLVQVPEYIRNAEELVCITYLGFVQNILGRIRTMALGIVWLFVAITVSVSTYPFDPRPTLNKALVFLFVAVGIAIVLVYAEMHRDSTLSRVTNTTPGELGVEFWLKIVGFGVGPFIGLLAYIFPGLTAFLFSWLEPSLTSFK